MICWIPLYTMNCINAFCKQCFINESVTFFGIILSHVNSAINPLLYAYHLKVSLSEVFVARFSSFTVDFLSGFSRCISQVVHVHERRQYILPPFFDKSAAAANNFECQPKPKTLIPAEDLRRFTCLEATATHETARHNRRE